MFELYSEQVSSLTYFLLGACFYAILDMLRVLYRIFFQNPKHNDKSVTVYISKNNYFRSNNGWFARRDRLPVPMPEQLEQYENVAVAMPVMVYLSKHYRQAVVMFVLYNNLSYHFYELCDDDWAYFYKTKSFMLQNSIDRTNEVIYWKYLPEPPNMDRLPRYEEVIERRYVST